MRLFLLQKYEKLKYGAAAMEMTPATLSPYLHDRVQPGTQILRKLLKLGCDLNWLLGGEGADGPTRSFESTLREERFYVKEDPARYKVEKGIKFESQKEKEEVEGAINVLMFISRSYQDFMDEDEAKILREILLAAEVKRYRRYGSKEFQEFISKWKNNK